MGHAIGDVDSLVQPLAFIGLERHLIKVHIVINETTALRPMINRFIDNPDYEDDLFIQNEQARSLNTIHYCNCGC